MPTTSTTSSSIVTPIITWIQNNFFDLDLVVYGWLCLLIIGIREKLVHAVLAMAKHHTSRITINAQRVNGSCDLDVVNTKR